jgi:hypothetical protein
MSGRATLRALCAVVVIAGLPRPAAGHCDTLDGPVVKDAQRALAARDPRVVFKWIGPEKEDEVRRVFQHALTVRALGAEAGALADRFFFETVVRLHRAGEGAPYSGLKPAGSVDPAITTADAALETGRVEALARMLTASVERGLRERFARVLEVRGRREESVAGGREYVAAYVELMHYIERLHEDARHAGREAAAPADPHAP